MNSGDEKSLADIYDEACGFRTGRTPEIRKLHEYGLKAVAQSALLAEQRHADELARALEIALDRAEEDFEGTVLYNWCLRFIQAHEGRREGKEIG